MGLVLIVAGGFLCGGVYALWQQSGLAAGPKRGQLRVIAAAIGLCAAVALVGGVLRLVSG